MSKFSNSDQGGQILIAIVLAVPFFLLMIAAYLNYSSSSFNVARRDQLSTSSQLAADSGADVAVEQINQNAGWTGTGGEVTLHNDGKVKTTYSATVTANSSTSKTITVTGKSYWPAGQTKPNTTTIINVGMRAVTAGDFSVASGEGGLQMKNSSKITGGDVYINGTVSLSNTAQIGLSTNPVNVFIADQACPIPPDATYPRLCTAADHPAQPISINNTPWIYGNVQANNQVSGSRMSNPGLTASSGVSTVALPTYNRDAQKAAVTTTIANGFSCSSGSQTWLANTKIVGNVSLSNSCKVTVKGNVWITGSLTISNSAQMVVDDSLGTTQPVIMVDGSDGVSIKNSANIASNISSTGFEIITFYSTAPCSPNCATVTGSDLYNSQGVTTITLDNTAVAPQTVLYAYWTAVLIKNNGQIGALIGQTIQLQNSGTITFTTSTGAGTTSWVVNGYRRSF